MFNRLYFGKSNKEFDINWPINFNLLSFKIELDYIIKRKVKNLEGRLILKKMKDV